MRLEKRILMHNILFYIHGNLKNPEKCQLCSFENSHLLYVRPYICGLTELICDIRSRVFQNVSERVTHPCTLQMERITLKYGYT